VYVWADGVHFNVRLEDEQLAALVVIGARPDGTKEVVALEDGYRESTESWLALLRDLKERGMRAPVVAVGDGALGFWAAIDGAQVERNDGAANKGKRGKIAA
jgi:putative transposase